MARAAKIAVSIDVDLLRRVEDVRARTGESRSAAVCRALRLLTREEERARRIEDYRRAYRETPESGAETEAARAAARRALAVLPWDAEGLAGTRPDLQRRVAKRPAKKHGEKRLAGEFRPNSE